MEAPLLIGPGYEQGPPVEGPFTGRDGQVPSSPRVAHRALPLPGRIGGQCSPACSASGGCRLGGPATRDYSTHCRQITSESDILGAQVHWARMSNPSFRRSGHTWRGSPAASASQRIARSSWRPRPAWTRRARAGPRRALAGRAILAGPRSCRDGPVSTGSTRGNPGARSRMTAPGAAASAAPRICPSAIRPILFPGKRIIWHSYSAPGIHAVRANRAGIVTIG